MTDVHFFSDVGRRKVDNDSLLPTDSWGPNPLLHQGVQLGLDEGLAEEDVDEARAGHL